MDYPKPDDIESVAKSVFDKAVGKIKDELTNAYYDEITSYLYDHFSNFDAKVRRETVRKIAEEFGSDPSKHEFADIRKAVFDSNKDNILGSLTDEVINAGLSKALEGYCDNKYHFSWRWKDGIAKFIRDNWHLFKDDERISAAFLRDLRNKDEYIESLKRRISEYENQGT